ncbi:uncharacterized protein LOC118744233 [Rhagoletis pomonella]|uniref:uncharacterized protein LOC118744233 n=1 Tax=Rhagoletis pomonella TaxID=28610 RepID=UPI0017816E5C|nr:uncharacterized protein LOC118744233 [Rhagoletis pomonella]
MKPWKKTVDSAAASNKMQVEAEGASEHDRAKSLISCQNSASDERHLKALWRQLHHNIHAGLVLLFDDQVSDEYVFGLLKFCAEHDAVNVIALQPQMAVRERSYWTLKLFPMQATIKRKFPLSYRNIFPEHLENMYGHPLRLMAVDRYIDFYNYTREEKSSKLSGFIGRALNESLFRIENRKAVEENIIDIGILWPLYVENTISFPTFVMHIKNWCLMVPVETPLPPYDFYWVIISSSVASLFLISLVSISTVWAITLRCKSRRQLSIVQHFLNVSVFQGLLGMPFWTNRSQSGIQKFLTITISFADIILGTAYSTYLQSFNVYAPTDHYIRNIDELLSYGIKVAVDPIDVDIIKYYTNFPKYIQNFTIFNNITELRLLRNELDTRYAYFVGDMWIMYDMQQKYFSKPLFRLSDICFGKEIPFVLPLPRNSIYRKSLNSLILYLQQSGLMSYWLHHSFIELTEMKMFNHQSSNEMPTNEGHSSSSSSNRDGDDGLKQQECQSDNQGDEAKNPMQGRRKISEKQRRSTENLQRQLKATTNT